MPLQKADYDSHNHTTRKLRLAKGSCGEFRSQLYVALDQGYISRNEFDRISDKTVEIARMVSGLMKYLRDSGIRGSKYK